MGRLLLILALGAASLTAADATGKWVGTLTVLNGSGTEESRPAMLVLKQDGVKLTGTVGPDESERIDIDEGKVEDGRLVFQVSEKGMKFDLKQDGDQLTGEITRERNGQVQKAKVSVKRQPE